MRTNIALDIFLEYKKVLYSSLNFLREKDGLHFLKGLVSTNFGEKTTGGGTCSFLADEWDIFLRIT